MSDSNTNALFGVLAAICIALSGFALKFNFDANADIKVMNVQMDGIIKSVETLSKKSELDKKQDSQLGKHWKLHTWTKKEIDEMRFKDGNGPSEWPNLNGPLNWE